MAAPVPRPCRLLDQEAWNCSKTLALIGVVINFRKFEQTDFVFEVLQRMHFRLPFGVDLKFERDAAQVLLEQEWEDLKLVVFHRAYYFPKAIGYFYTDWPLLVLSAEFFIRGTKDWAGEYREQLGFGLRADEIFEPAPDATLPRLIEVSALR